MQTNVLRDVALPVTDGVVIRTEGLTKIYDTGVTGGRSPRPRGARGRDLRAARAERRRQDDDDRDADDDASCRPAGHAYGRGRRRRAPTPSRPSGCIGRRLADEHARPQPHGVGEPLLPRPLLRRWARAPTPRAAPTSCSSCSGSPTARTPTCRRSPAGMAQRLMVARAHRPPPARCSSWTSRPPASTRRPGSRLWEIIGDLHAEGQTVAAHDPLHGGGRPALRAGRDHGPREAARARRAADAEASVGADTVVHLEVEGDLEGLVRRPDGARRDRRRDVVDGLHALAEGAQAHGLLPRIVATAEDAGFTVRDASMTEPTLETVFITLTGKELRE